MSLSLIGNPQKTIIICIDNDSFFESDVSELDFRWTLANQQSDTQSITLTNVGVGIGSVLSISLPTGFFTTASFPQTVAGGDSIVVPIYFLYNTTGDYSGNSVFTAINNIVSVSLLGGVDSVGLQFDGVNDYVISTQDVSWERTQAWTFFFKYKDIDFTQNSRNPLFAFYGASRFVDSLTISGATVDGTLFMSIRKSVSPSNELTARFANRNTLPTSGIIQITYAGNSLLTDFRLYSNNVERTTRGMSQVQTLTSNIVAAGQKAIIGQNDFAVYLTANAKIQEVSFVNYVKSGAELSADYSAGFQSKGSGDYLFRQSFNVGGTPLNLEADILGGTKVDTTIIGQTSGNFVAF